MELGALIECGAVPTCFIIGCSPTPDFIPWSQVVPYVPGLKVVADTRLGGVQLGALIKFALTTPVLFVVGWPIHRGAVRSLRHGSANMCV